MNQSVSNRHEGDLGGLFTPFGDVGRLGVTVEVAAASAALPSVQHTAWMLINLLARFEGVVHRVGVSCPKGVELCGRIVPIAPREIDLRSSLLIGGQSIGVVPVEADARLERTIVVGGGGPEHGDFFVFGNAWSGGVSQAPLDVASFGPSSALPFGPYVAACIGAGEVFKAARMREGKYVAPKAAFYSAWDHHTATRSITAGLECLGDIVLDAALAGVGAVGCALVHTLWACPTLAGNLFIADNDEKGLEISNLNRYSLFGVSAVGRQKASAAAEVAFDATFNITPRDEGVECLPLQVPRIISAVDRNSSRAAIQNRYPARIFSGSTLDLRAEVLRCGPPGLGACLRCFNPPERAAPDEEMRAQLLLAPASDLARLAAAAGIGLDEAREWLNTGRCGIVGERLLPHLRRSEGEHGAFAVAFVSVMAGTMLAAEFVKDHLRCAECLSSSVQRAVFQFLSPLAHSNRASAYGRDPCCPMCDPSTLACQKWMERYAKLILS